MEDTVTTEAVETTEAPQSIANFIGEDGTFKEGWKNVVPEEYRGEKCLDLFNDFNGLVKTTIHGQKSFGKDKVVIPGENASQEDIDAFRKAVGVPETVDDYDFKVPEGWNADAVNGLKALAHENAFSDKQFNAIRDFIVNHVEASETARAEAEQNAIAEAEKELKTKWGDAYDERLHLANRVINDTTQEGEGREALLARIGNDPIVAEWVAELGMKLVESKAVDKKARMQTPKEINAEISELQATPGYMNGSMKQQNPIAYKQLHDKITRLYEQAYS